MNNRWRRVIRNAKRDDPYRYLTLSITVGFGMGSNPRTNRERKMAQHIKKLTNELFVKLGRQNRKPIKWFKVNKVRR